MPYFVSNMGVWTPGKERAVNIKTGEVYEGPDREAIKELKAAGQDYLGMNVKEDPENIMRARQLGMTVEDFLKLNIPPSAQAKANEEAKQVHVQDQQKPNPRKPGVQPAGGGVTKKGGFGEMPE